MRAVRMGAYTGFIPTSSILAVLKNMPCKWLQQRFR